MLWIFHSNIHCYDYTTVRFSLHIFCQYVNIYLIKVCDINKVIDIKICTM